MAMEKYQMREILRRHNQQELTVDWILINYLSPTPWILLDFPHSHFSLRSDSRAHLLISA